jgi:hypothetical protein
MPLTPICRHRIVGGSVPPSGRCSQQVYSIKVADLRVLRARPPHNWNSSHTLSEQTHPQNSRYTPRCPSVVLWTPCSGVERLFEPAINTGSGTTGKQPANLPVEGVEESLSILPDYIPTVRPPPKRS